MRIVDCVVNDSSDYEWMHESAISNTIGKYFEWADNNNINVQFTKSYDDELVYGLKLYIDAKFDHPEDRAQFVITFGNKPFTRLKESEGGFKFGHN
jgi:hypothetical protein|tara:strand:- start:408 stop:695 length:288 start_codon:yes stop_codon:yes gene_type:complete